MFWKHLVEDAALFPPAALPLEQAVAQHRDHLASEYADLVDALVVPDTKLADLRELADPERPLALTVLVTGGAGAIEPAVRWAQGDGLELRRLRVALRDEDDLARNAQRVVAMVDHCALEVPVHVEVPRVSEHSWRSALDEVAMADLGLTFRADDDLAGSLEAALDRETPFLVVGGPAVEVLEAAGTALHGDPTPEGWDSTRRWLVAMSCPDVMEVHEDLVELDLWRSA